MSNIETGTHEIIIPFTGFYESIHSYAIDDEIEMMYSDEETGTVIDEEKCANFPHDTQLHIDYAKLYVDEFNGLFKDPPFAFQELISPSEYNFTTDRIFCTIKPEFIAEMFLQIDKDTLQSQFEAHFTSCSGFTSFYDPTIPDKNPLEWDCNELMALLDAYIVVMEIDTNEPELMENARGNGEITTIIYECLDRNEVKV